MATRNEIRLEAAKKRTRAADAKLSRAYEASRAALEAVTKKHQPHIWAASRRVRETRVAQTVAELACHGITPMRTIIGYRGNRYAVQVSREGWAQMAPIGAKGRVMKNRAWIPTPYQMRGVTIMDGEVQE